MPDETKDQPMSTSVHVLLDPSGYGDPVLAIDSVSLNGLAVATAGVLLDFVYSHADDDVSERARHGGGGIIADSFQAWAEHGVTNAMLRHAEILYALLSARVSMPANMHGFFMALENPHIVTEALAAFQAWKELRISKDKAAMGKPEWGDGMGWNQATWDNLNAAYIEWWVGLGSDKENDHPRRWDYSDTLRLQVRSSVSRRYDKAHLLLISAHANRAPSEG